MEDTGIRTADDLVQHLAGGGRCRVDRDTLGHPAIRAGLLALLAQHHSVTLLPAGGAVELRAQPAPRPPPGPCSPCPVCGGRPVLVGASLSTLQVTLECAAGHERRRYIQQLRPQEVDLWDAYLARARSRT